MRAHSSCTHTQKMSREHTGKKPLSISQGKSPDQELNLLKLWSLDSSASKTARNRLCGLNKSHLSYFVIAIWADNVYPYNGYRISFCTLYVRLFPAYYYYLSLFFNNFYFFTLCCLTVYILVSSHNSFELKLDLKTRTMSCEGLYVIISCLICIQVFF